MSIALCYGTRPQVVKASVLLDALRRRWSVVSIDTGQHYDEATAFCATTKQPAAA